MVQVAWRSLMSQSIKGSGHSGLVLLGEVEDLAMGLAEVLLLFEVHLKRTLNGYKCYATLQKERGSIVMHHDCFSTGHWWSKM